MQTQVYLLLDMTGSMQPKKQETIDACNEYIQALQSDPHTSDFVFSLGVFNSNIGLERVVTQQPIQKVQVLSHEQYQPAASTPLFDAIAGAAKDLEQWQGPVLFIIQTDGEENCSRNAKREDIVKLVADNTKAGWQFVYLGCDLDAMKAGAALGVAAGSTMSYAGGQSVSTMARVASETTRYSMRASMPVPDFFDPDADKSKQKLVAEKQRRRRYS